MGMDSKSLDRRTLSMPASPPPRSALSRSQTPPERFDNMHVALATVHAVYGVTRYAMTSLGSLDRQRQAIAAELPETAELLIGLEVNAARLMAGVQNSLLNDETTVII